MLGKCFESGESQSKTKKKLFGKCKKYSQKTEEILSLRYWVVEKKFPIRYDTITDTI